MKPALQDAAVLYTIDDQPYLHRFGVKLRDLRPRIAEQVFVHQPVDVTASPRRVTVGGRAHDLVARIALDGMPTEALEFLAAARRGASLQLIPSLASPGYAIPCEVVDATPPELTPDPELSWTYTTDVTFRRLDGGSWRGLTERPLLYFLAGHGFGLTFTRAGSNARYTDRDGVLQTVAANAVSRIEWLYTATGRHSRPTTPHLLNEEARTNLVTDDDLTAWGTVGSPVVTGSISDPAGGTGAYRVEDNDGAAEEYIVDTVTFGSSGARAVLFVVREATHPTNFAALILRQTSGAPATRLLLDITGWTNGSPDITATTGTFIGKRYLGNGYWVVYGQSTAVTHTETHQVQVRPATTNADTGSIDVYRVNAFDNLTPTWSVLDASEVRAEEVSYLDFEHPAQAAAFYLKFREVDLVGTFSENLQLFEIQDGSAGSPKLALFKLAGTDQYRLQLDNGVDAVVRSTLDLDPSWDDTIELRGIVNPDGSVQLHGAKEGGAESSATASLAPTNGLPTDWSGTRLYLGSAATSNVATLLLQELKVLDGAGRTLAELQAL